MMASSNDFSWGRIVIDKLSGFLRNKHRSSDRSATESTSEWPVDSGIVTNTPLAY